MIKFGLTIYVDAMAMFRGEYKKSDYAEMARARFTEDDYAHEQIFDAVDGEYEDAKKADEFHRNAEMPWADDILAKFISFDKDDSELDEEEAQDVPFGVVPIRLNCTFDDEKYLAYVSKLPVQTLTACPKKKKKVV